MKWNLIKGRRYHLILKNHSLFVPAQSVLIPRELFSCHQVRITCSLYPTNQISLFWQYPNMYLLFNYHSKTLIKAFHWLSPKTWKSFMWKSFIKFSVPVVHPLYLNAFQTVSLLSKDHALILSFTAKHILWCICALWILNYTNDM